MQTPETSREPPGANDAVIAVIGGTGNLGAAIARRLALAGRNVIVGSRDAVRAAEAAKKLSAGLPLSIRGAANAEAAQAGSVVIVAVPFASQRQVLAEIREHVRGKIVVDATVPLVPPKVARAQLPAEGSAAQIAQQVLGQDVRVVSAFHNIAAHKLALPDPVDCDVLVFGDDKSARETVIDLARACQLRALHAGSLANSAAAEALTSVLIFINRHYGVDGAGIRITGPAE
jgi:8-hydroxy-5-deazaflavin:NADPH oxidoreductase